MMVSRMPDITGQYEQIFAGHVEAGNAVAFSFARHALVAALTAAGLQPGDEILLSPLTCKVVPLAILSLGLKPVYADISPATLNIDPVHAGSRLSSATRAILFQHTYGHPGGVDAVTALASRHKLFMVEDCAQCMPHCTETYRPGQYGAVAIFSNNAGKPLSAGSGGVAVTDSAQLASRIRDLRDRLPHWKLAGDLRVSAETWLHRHLLRPSLYWTLFDLHRRMAGNYSQRPLDTEITAEITATARQPSTRQLRRGLRALRDVADIARHRTACCADYRAALGPDAWPGAPYDSGRVPLYYYPLLSDNKAALLQRARKSRIELVPWPVAAPIYPLEHVDELSVYGYRSGACPQAEALAGGLVGLPTHPRITPAVRRQIIDFLQASH